MTEEQLSKLTDEEIREWMRSGMETTKPVLYALLKELLAYRSLKLLPCWRVWCPDKSEQGWRVLGAFPSKQEALCYREMMRQMVLPLPELEKALVLEGHEEPSMTAR